MKKVLLMLAAVIILISCSPQEKTDEQQKSEPTTKIQFDREIFSAEMLMSLKRISGLQLSPDANWILYTLKTPNLEENSFNNDIFLTSADGKITKQITVHPKSDYSPIWSPDGKTIAFLSSRNGSPQIYTVEFNGENTDDISLKQITDIENGVANISWSPDGEHFAFTSDVKIHKSVEDLYPEFTKAKVRIYKEIPVRHWSEWTDESFSHLFVIPSKGGEAKDLMEGEPYDSPMKPFGGAEQISWSPDSKEIAYVSKKDPNFAEHTNSEIYLISADGGNPNNITDGMPGFDYDPLYSPDGKWIAFISLRRPSFESDKHRLMLYNRMSGEIFELSDKFDRWVGEKIWAPDSKSIYFTAGDSGKVKIFNMLVEDGTYTVFADGNYNHGGGLCISHDGKSMFYAREDMMNPADIYSQKTDGASPVQITALNSEMMSELKPVAIEERWFTSKDRKNIHAWIVYPPDFDSTKQYPMISYCQGGPQAMIGQRFHFRWNYYLMASKGYVVLLPNRRGVPGFGQDWNDAISGDWGGMPMQDIITATDQMKEEPYIKKDGLGAVGASAGGYAAFWLAGNHEKRFQAFVAHCGVFNLTSMYGSTEELWFPNWEYGGPYWEDKNKKFYEQHSPHTYADNWDTPILISTGEHDYRVPYTQSLEAFTVAQVKGIPAELIVFPEETHFIAHPQEFAIWSKEFFGFLDKYLK